MIGQAKGFARAGRAMRRAVLLAGFLVLADAAPAEVLPEPHRIAEESEAESLAALTEILMSAPSDPSSVGARLDALLPQLARPTPLRGFVQWLRGEALLRAHRDQAARDAIEESVRLLPGYSGPLLLASRMEAYGDRAARAVDYLLRASIIDPEVVREIPDYEVGNILHRMSGAEALRHESRLAQRLFEVGWRGERLSLRSSLARALIEAKVAEGDLAGARAAFPHLASPLDVRRLLVQNRYQGIWEDLEKWAGPRQERLWPTYLAETRERWAASEEPDLAGPYLSALEAVNRDRQIVAEFQRLVSGPFDPEKDYGHLWTVSRLADALARLGRWSDIDGMFERAQQAWPAGSDVNALNVAANRGRLSYVRGDYAAAERQLRAAIARAETRRAETSARAIGVMHYYLACALHRQGRDAEALASVPHVLRMESAATSASLYLCHDRKEAAREVLIAGLANEAQRDEVLDFVQLKSVGPAASEEGRRTWTAFRELRADPVLLKAVEQHGRVLPYPPEAGVPEHVEVPSRTAG